MRTGCCHVTGPPTNTVGRFLVDQELPHHHSRHAMAARVLPRPLLQDFGLHKYAENFAQNSMAVFVFDYRGWGGSGGEPRHWLSAKRHMADWRAAIAYVRSSMAGSVDIDRLCLWGSSFAGGHVLVVGSEPTIAPHITAIVSQVRALFEHSTRGSSKNKAGGKRCSKMGVVIGLIHCCSAVPGPVLQAASLPFLSSTPPDAPQHVRVFATKQQHGSLPPHRISRTCLT